jgi:hypothetical protein
MNFCDERHETKYLVTYKPAEGSRYSPVWQVCESCLELKNHFGSDDIIQSVSKLTLMTK